MARFDVVIVGGGHNGLTCAAYLARSGKKVAVLEARSRLGGVAVGDEFAEGFFALGPIADGATLRPWIAEELKLAAHGLQRTKAVTLVRGAGGEIELSRDVDATAASIAKLSGRDARAYREFCAFIDSLRGVLQTFTDRPPLDLVRLEDESKLGVLARALGIRRLGRERMMELLRIAPMSAADFLGEFFESSLVKAAIALPAISQTYAGPRAPGTAANILLHRTASSEGDFLGGSAAIAGALTKAAEQHGVTVRLDCKVTAIELEGERAAAVLVGDERIEAGAIVCACDPKTAMLELLPRATLPALAEKHVADVRSRGTIGHLSLAIDGEVALPGGASRMLVVDDLDAIERAFDAVKYQTHSSHPVLDVAAASTSDGLCPPGNTVLGVRVHYLPHRLDDGFTSELVASMTEAAMRPLLLALPELEGKVLASELLTPFDLAERFGVHGGHLEHGEMALDQIAVRPTPECVGYRTPVSGLLLASSGSHPGGGITGVPGALAAKAVLKSL